MINDIFARYRWSKTLLCFFFFLLFAVSSVVAIGEVHGWLTMGVQAVILLNYQRW